MIDPTHNIKNALNNWSRKCVFVYPPGSDLLTAGQVADFRHIQALFFHEETKVLKAAHKLQKNSLNPNSIAKTSFRHALGDFSRKYSRKKNSKHMLDTDCSTKQQSMLFGSINTTFG